MCTPGPAQLPPPGLYPAVGGGIAAARWKWPARWAWTGPLALPDTAHERPAAQRGQRGGAHHHRYHPRVHAFGYKMAQLYLDLDLDEQEQVFPGRWLWSVGRRNLARSERADSLGLANLPLTEAVIPTARSGCSRTTCSSAAEFRAWITWRVSASSSHIPRTRRGDASRRPTGWTSPTPPNRRNTRLGHRWCHRVACIAHRGEGF